MGKPRVLEGAALASAARDLPRVARAPGRVVRPCSRDDGGSESLFGDRPQHCVL